MKIIRESDSFPLFPFQYHLAVWIQDQKQKMQFCSAWQKLASINCLEKGASLLYNHYSPRLLPKGICIKENASLQTSDPFPISNKQKGKRGGCIIWATPHPAVMAYCISPLEVHRKAMTFPFEQLQAFIHSFIHSFFHSFTPVWRLLQRKY